MRSRWVSMVLMRASIAHSGCHFQHWGAWVLVLLGLVCIALISLIVSVIVVFDVFDLCEDVCDCAWIVGVCVV